MRLFLRVQPLHETRKSRLGQREKCSVSGAMDYQQKLAEKLVILTERGNGVLTRMNHIKKVRESWNGTSQKKKKGTGLLSHRLGN